MYDEIDYITKEELLRNNFHGLHKGKVYEIVGNVHRNTVFAESFIQTSFLIRKSGSHSIFFKIDGSPKYFTGLFSLYAIIRAAKNVADREEDLLELGVIDEPEYQEIIIEQFPAMEHSTGLELIRTIDDSRLKLAKMIKEDLLVEAKNYNLVDSMDIFL
ncbi:hypothetical protein [Mesobacillus maritimus]|uniref:IDEAL domain-containing protein n=1 Tax=Mesobacillus maritimus TaxID=1643336 RepID=A0ABS7KBN6_9BACI|nr:hypothetical protein [Mesobacillus maritimus]MBY0099687.1 hypothetical protein [Mesobacillus maritimus]